MSSSSGEPSPNTLLSIPLKYTYLSKPVTDKERSQRVFYETKVTETNDNIWRPVDTRDASGEFKQTLNASLFTDNLPSLRNITESIANDGKVSARLVEERLLENTLTINLSGPSNIVSQERAKVLRSYYQVERRHIGLDAADYILNNNNNNDLNMKDDDHSAESSESQIKEESKRKPKRSAAVAASKKLNRSASEEQQSEPPSMFNPQFIEYLDQVADFCGVSIFVTDFIDKIPYGIGYHTELNSESANKPYHILIYGDQDSARYAEFKVNILLEKLKGNFVASIPLPLSLQPLVAGPHLTNFKYIKAVTNTQIFAPEWLPELFASQSNNPHPRNLNEIYVTGEEFHVTLAKVMINEVVKKTTPLVKDCVVSFAKIDLLSLRFQDNLRKLMVTHGTFIQIPYLGAARAVVRVQSTSVPICSLTISQFMELTSLLYNASYCVHTGEEDGQGNLVQPDIPIDFDILDKVAAGSGATITCKNNSFDIIGYKSDTKRAVSMIKSLPIWGKSKQQVKYRLELANDQCEFISGKKNGKILRIMNTASVWIKLLPFNEFNFYVDIYSEYPPEATNGLKLLEDELPSQTEFYIPETYHKRVIGAGGSTVQGIMRKYNVFVKFSGSHDINPNGFAYLKSPNVLIRCPAKNSKEIAPAKEELLDTVLDRSQEHGTTFVKLTRSHMRILLNSHLEFVSEIESKTNTIVELPEESEYENYQQKLLIRGYMDSSDGAARLVKTKLPEDYEFKVAQSSKFHELVNENSGDFYQRIVLPFKLALKIETLVNYEPEHTSEEAPYHQILLSFAQENSVGLEDAIQALTVFLRDKGLDIIDRGEYHTDPIVPGSQGTVSSQSSSSFGGGFNGSNKRRNRAHTMGGNNDRPFYNNHRGSHGHSRGPSLDSRDNYSTPTRDRYNRGMHRSGNSHHSHSNSTGGMVTPNNSGMQNNKMSNNGGNSRFGNPNSGRPRSESYDRFNNHQPPPPPPPQQQQQGSGRRGNNFPSGQQMSPGSMSGYRHEDIRGSSHPYRKGPMPTPPQRRTSGYRNGSGGSNYPPSGNNNEVNDNSNDRYYEEQRPSYSQGYRSPGYRNHAPSPSHQQQPSSQQPMYNQGPQQQSSQGYHDYPPPPPPPPQQQQQVPVRYTNSYNNDPHQRSGRHMQNSSQGGPAPYYSSRNNSANSNNSNNSSSSNQGSGRGGSSNYHELSPPPPPPPGSSGSMQSSQMGMNNGNNNNQRYYNNNGGDRYNNGGGNNNNGNNNNNSNRGRYDYENRGRRYNY